MMMAMTMTHPMMMIMMGMMMIMILEVIVVGEVVVVEVVVVMKIQSLRDVILKHVQEVVPVEVDCGGGGAADLEDKGVPVEEMRDSKMLIQDKRVLILEVLIRSHVT